MKKIMIEFKDITLKDKDLITAYTQNSSRRNCDLSFSNLCSWRFLYDTQFAVVDNFLLFKFFKSIKYESTTNYQSKYGGHYD